MTIQIRGLPEPHAARVRRTRSDGHGNEALAAITAGPDGGMPCRVCLREAAAGEEVLLFSYTPFCRPRPYRAIGPVFIHAGPCVPYPTPAAIPPLLLPRTLALRAYDGDERMLASDLVEGAAVETLLARLFADPAAAEVHVHSARAGCFLCAVVRS